MVMKIDGVWLCETCDAGFDETLEGYNKAVDCERSHIEGATSPMTDEPELLGRAAPPVLAPELLGRAAAHMHGRASTYDKPEGERSMGRAVQAFNAVTGHALSEAEGWLLLQVLKDVRLFTRSAYHADSAEDCIAYAALKAEAKARE